MSRFDFSGNVARGDFGAKFIEPIIITETVDWLDIITKSLSGSSKKL